MLGTRTATATVSDNDPLTVIVEGPDRVPANSSEPTYTVRLKVGAGSGTGSATVEVDYTVDGTAYELSIPPNTSSVDIPTANTGIGDKVEDDTLVVRLTGASTTAGTVRVGRPSTKSTTIVNANTVTVSLPAAEVNVTEGNDATFRVTSASGADGVTVRYQVVAGSADSKDYERPSGTLVLDSAGLGTITVSVVDDGVVEGAETFSVQLTGLTLPSGVDNVVLGRTTAMATIAANSQLTATVAPQEETATVLEGSAALFVVSLPGTANQNIVVDYTVDGGTGTNGVEEEDYTAPSGKLTIRTGSSTGTISIRIVDDGLLEPAETLRVTLDDATPRTVVNEPQDTTATVAIGDSGRTVTVSVDGAERNGDGRSRSGVHGGVVGEGVRTRHGEFTR